MTQRKLSLIPSQKERFERLISVFPKARVLVIGDFILDEFIWGKVTRISPEAPVPVVRVERESFMPGGSLNVANNIATLGGQVVPVGVLGKDLYGRMLVRKMRAQGIDASGVVVDAKRPTTLKTRIIAHHQQVVRFDREKLDDLSADVREALVAAVRSKLPETDVVIVEDYGKGVITEALLKELIPMILAAGKKVLVDPKEKHIDYYKGVTSMTPNRYEAYGALGLSVDDKVTVEEVGERLLKKLEMEALVITLGEEGMALFEKDGKVTKIPTVAREVFDVSGAGDTVIATFGLALAAGASFFEAAMISNWAGGIVVGKLGTATVSAKELTQAIKGGS